MYNVKKWFKRILCKLFGHKWITYSYSTGYYSYDVEQAGICRRCGCETHKV